MQSTVVVQVSGGCQGKHIDSLSLQALLIAHTSATHCCDCCCRDDPLLDIAMELERVATHDSYFVQRGL